ncbi:MAG: hypothetical protein E4G90_09740 [Gemmatimonadales bacterium]|nr:MAG: hypothetical protein E4G90_09740 [Gemmatimonadales bacterium]
MSTGDRLLSGGMAFVAIAAIVGYVILAAALGEGFAIPVAIIGTISGAVVLRGPVGKALARRLEGGGAMEPNEDVLLELDELRTRVVELEERQDFAERLLASGREAGSNVGLHGGRPDGS